MLKLELSLTRSTLALETDANKEKFPTTRTRLRPRRRRRHRRHLDLDTQRRADVVGAILVLLVSHFGRFVFMLATTVNEVCKARKMDASERLGANNKR